MKLFGYKTLLTVMFTSSCSWGQNLVPNPSFENVTQCPFAFGLESFTSDWVSSRESPDYFNACATWQGASIPSNTYGFQEAHAGSGYIGMLVYRTDSSILTEAASVQLSSQLTIGQTYYISFQLSLTPEYDIAWSANNKIGVQFSTVQYSQSNPAPINNFAHVWTDSIITDTLGWQKIRGVFTADSSYTHLSIGNFFDAPNVDTILMDGDLIDLLGSYYFIDDVCVSTDSLTCVNSVGIDDTPFNQTTFNIYPNPATNQITVENLQLGGAYKIQIYNSLGQLMYTDSEVYASNYKIDIGAFRKGLLFVRIKSGEQNYSFKIIKN